MVGLGEQEDQTAELEGYRFSIGGSAAQEKEGICKKMPVPAGQRENCDIL